MPATTTTLEKHVATLQEGVRLAHTEDTVPPRRGGRPATALQGLQQRIRQEVADYAHRLQEQGLTRPQRAAALHLSPYTLRSWEHHGRTPTIFLVPVGRPWVPLPWRVRQEIIAFLTLVGPGVGVPTLRTQFADVPRAALRHLLDRFRVVWQARHQRVVRILHWQTPGRIWAADFTQPSHPGGSGLPPIADRYPYLLAVRDLASGMMLAWQPLPDLTAEVTRIALACLFAQHGAPLILKTDNGSAFRADAWAEFLEESGVIPLYSPPSSPGYNGSIEAAIGALKQRTEQHARQRGLVEHWTLADLDAALATANTSHPRRLNGRTPAALWPARTRIAPPERVAFQLTVERHRFQVRSERNIDQAETLDHWRARAVDRQAIQRALVEHGHLLFTGRRIPLGIRAGKVTSDG